MTAELTALALAGVLQAATLCWLALRANLEVGTQYFLTARDGPPPRELSLGTARLKRAYQNHGEALLLFALAVVVVSLAGASNAFTALCAWLYLGARVLYVPAYLLDWNPGRSVIWAAGFVATVALLIAALL